ncbi:MAG: PorV/PorQ family protein [Candidatus Kapaibacteriota bacterium]
MKIYSIMIVCFLSISSCIRIEAQSPFDFIQLGISARSAGLGGAFTSMTQDQTALFFNPGTLATIDSSTISATFMKHVLDISSGMATYTLPIEKNSTERISISAVYTTYGSFDRTDEFGSVTGSFSANNVGLMGTYSNELDSILSYGISAKFMYATLDDLSSTALAMDAGILYRIPASRTNIGFSLLNIGTQLSTFEGITDRMPIDVRVGINHRLRGLPLLLNFSLHHLADDADAFFDRIGNFSIGGEFILSKVLDLRIGYDNYVRNATSIQGQRRFSGFAAGVGVRTAYVQVDYGVSALGTAGSIHRLTLHTSL